MFERLARLPDDAILGLMAAFRADSDPHKVDLGVGVYRDDQGRTPVLEAVRQAEQALLERQTTKTYVGSAGNADFNQAMERLALGEDHPALAAGRVRTIQAPGGCGALRLGAELIRTASPESVVHVSTPTWVNHVPLLSGSGLKLERYPYFDPSTGGVQFEAMLAALERLSARAVVLLHASCHNPTGADLTEGQWHELLTLFKQRQLLPFIDIAYQGLGSGVAQDAFGIRLFCAQLPEVAVAASCSKNFGLYRERTGALHVISETPAAADAVLSQLVRTARSIYSMPPDHGAAIVHNVLADNALRELWVDEVAGMRRRLQGLRQQVLELRTRHHIYMTDDSRMNIAGLREDNLEYFAHAVARVLKAR
ncbi:MAG: aspartate/tyrosine/aromatic aminotransferase [Gammaproteobacteria bacterium]|nr:MAG: aspartate/tyrosine/aromatic aminotransferase [Gammaproteobacteria bacterium]